MCQYITRPIINKPNSRQKNVEIPEYGNNETTENKDLLVECGTFNHKRNVNRNHMFDSI